MEGKGREEEKIQEFLQLFKNGIQPKGRWNNEEQPEEETKAVKQKVIDEILFLTAGENI